MRSFNIRLYGRIYNKFYDIALETHGTVQCGCKLLNFRNQIRNNINNFDLSWWKFDILPMYAYSR